MTISLAFGQGWTPSRGKAWLRSVGFTGTGGEREPEGDRGQGRSVSMWRSLLFMHTISGRLGGPGLLIVLIHPPTGLWISPGMQKQEVQCRH